jgi:hypothetical protein
MAGGATGDRPDQKLSLPRRVILKYTWNSAPKSWLEITSHRSKKRFPYP